MFFAQHRAESCLLFSAACAVAMTVVSRAPAAKETDPLPLSIKKNVDVGASARRDGTMEVWGTTSRHARDYVIGPLLLYKAALEAEKAGFHRIAVTKQKFWSTLMYGFVLSYHGQITVRFFKPDEAIPAGTDVFGYVDTANAITKFKGIVDDADSFAATPQDP